MQEYHHRSHSMGEEKGQSLLINEVQDRWKKKREAKLSQRGEPEPESNIKISLVGNRIVATPQTKITKTKYV
jgi:hypothetical protein